MEAFNSARAIHKAPHLRVEVKGLSCFSFDFHCKTFYEGCHEGLCACICACELVCALMGVYVCVVCVIYLCMCMHTCMHACACNACIHTYRAQYIHTCMQAYTHTKQICTYLAADAPCELRERRAAGVDREARREREHLIREPAMPHTLNPKS